MNNEIIKILKERNIHPISYKRIKGVYVINNKYVIKLNTNNYDIYRYLISKDFLYFPKNLNNLNDNYDMSLYVDNIEVNDNELINDYVKIISILHSKTSYKREIDLDEIKEKYENLNNKILSLKNYYQELNNKIDHEIFFSPSEYLLIRNISLIYSILDNSVVLLDKLYKRIKNEKSFRVSLLHNNVSLKHLITGDNKYLISWDKSYFDSPIYEIELIYRKYYKIIDLNNLIEIYELNNRLTMEERGLLLVNLSIPNRIELTNSTYSDTKIINKEINYLKKVYELLIKYENEL